MRNTAKTEEAAIELANVIEAYLDTLSESERLECLSWLEKYVETIRNKPN